MGVFGFLSKAHLDQAIPSGDVAAKVQIFDDKIRTQQDNIKAARAALTQMDSAVDQTMSRSTTEQGADKAANLRRSQGKERTVLQNDISKAQKEITTLQEQRAPIASEMRKVEAEVGPIKYIAALIYGDNPEANVLEKAVRWVIILIVVVFDPLALTLLLAATKTFEWERSTNVLNTKRKDDPFEDWTEEDFDTVNKSLKDAEEKEQADSILTQGVVASNPADNQPLVEKKLSWSGFGFPLSSIFNKKEEPEESVEQLAIDVGNSERPGDSLVKEDPTDLEKEDDDTVSSDDTPMKIAERAWKFENPNKTLKKQRQLLEAGVIPRLPWEREEFLNRVLSATKLEADNMPNTPVGEVKGFGIQFPMTAQKGDMFLRVDQIPSVLYKFNDRNWIEVDKNLSDQHAYDMAYIDHLIAKLDSGEYDPELLSNAEREAIEQRLS
jgi:hypothetical protein